MPPALAYLTAAFALTSVAALPPSAMAAERPDIVTRAAWKAKPALTKPKMKKQAIERITIHHTAVVRSKKRPTEQLVRNLQAFSQSDAKLADGRTKKAWADVPYHFYIGRDGTIVEGRDMAFAGDTNTNYDPTGHVAIAVSGNFEKQKPSPEQKASLVALVDWLAEEHGVAPDRIEGHKDHASTACPGRNLEAFLPELRRKVAATR